MKAPKWITGNSTSILSGLAVAGVVATAGLAIRATPKAMKKISNLRDVKVEEAGPLLKDQDEARYADPAFADIVKAVWKDYIPTAIAGSATIGCIVFANRIGLRRNAALLAAYTLVSGAFDNYKDEVLRVIGSKKEEEVRAGVAERAMSENPPNVREIVITTSGDQLCYDTLTGRYFRSDAESIRRAENDTDAQVLNDMYASLNDFYERLGLSTVKLGDELGWSIENRPKIVFTAHLSTVDAAPCLAIAYEHIPRVDYGKF